MILKDCNIQDIPKFKQILIICHDLVMNVPVNLLQVHLDNVTEVIYVTWMVTIINHICIQVSY